MKKIKYKLDPQKRDSVGNEYIILEMSGLMPLFKCVKFNGVEDLGDGIKCVRENQEIWVASYFARHMIESN